MKLEYPDVTIAIVKTREDYFEDALNSAKYQIYDGKLDIQVMDNTKKEHSIGYCYNRLVEDASGEWIMFLGDDDVLVPEYILSLMLYTMRQQNVNAVNVTSNCIWFDKEKSAPSEAVPQGMWKKSYLLENKFNEELERYVDSDLFSRTEDKEDVDMLYADWQYGYFYRQHDDNISYNKFDIVKEKDEKRKKSSSA